jgi:hypothetical protein
VARLNLDIIDQINQSVTEEVKEVRAEKLQDEDKLLEKNSSTAQKIDQERAVLSADSCKKDAFGLNKPKDEKKESFFNKPSSGNLDDFFKDRETEKKSSSSYSYNYSYSNQARREETEKDKAKEFSKAFAERAVKRAYKEWTKEEEAEKNSWNIFELQEKAEEERRRTRSLNKEDKKKLKRKDLLKKSMLHGIASVAKSFAEYLYRDMK